jgi:hypothetical protein
MISMAKRTVLFLAANPCGTDPRALDVEAHSIRSELKRSGYRDRFQLETRWAVQPLDLLRELRELQPAVVHFSGQGGPDGCSSRPLTGGPRSSRPRRSRRRLASRGPQSSWSS